jgi:predicted MFS family arabinose efflux permease
MYTYLGSGLISIGGFNTNEVASALIIYGIGAVFGSLSGGKLADSYGAGKIAALSLILLASTELIISEVIGIRQHEIILLSLGLFALVAYPCLPAYQAKLVENFPGESGKIMALNSSVMYLGTALGAAFGGFVIENMGFSSVSILAAAVGLLGSYLCFS